ncbi:hypothetical protein [uncultured Kingella sp.]|nr:hypothetical protein [uncultured Kingella sp.]
MHQLPNPLNKKQPQTQFPHFQAACMPHQAISPNGANRSRPPI